MLYERWCRTLESGPHRPALHEPAAGRTWTFADLDRAAAAPPAQPGPAHPTGRDASFIVEVLRAWRHGRVLCPLEPGQLPPSVPPPPAGIAHLKLTSSTTGPAKVIALTASQLAADVDHIVATMGLRPDWPNLGVLSLAHSYGFSNLVTPLLLHGIPLIVLPSALPAAVFTEAARWPAVTLPAVPALWQAWFQAGPLPASIRLAISAGAPLPGPLERGLFERDRLKVHNFLGASECGGIAYDATAVPREDPTVVGTPLRGVKVRVDEAGCLEVSGPAVAETYWPEPDPRLAGGTYRSTDLVDLAPSGEVRLLGRAADLINVAGRKVAPEQVETCLLSHPAVAEALVFGIPDQAGRHEAVGVALVCRRPTGEAELREHLSAHLPAWQWPRRWWFLDALPADARGKRSRRAWRDRLLGNAAG